MTVLAFLYHKTPAVVSEDPYDVSLQTFKNQINMMLDNGVSFIKFADVNNPEYLNSGMHVALTFDDGHACNGSAFEFLSDKGIVPTSFIVRAWSQHSAGYLQATDIRDLSSICDFGSHGSTHRSLAVLSTSDIVEELRDSRRYLEDALGHSIELMALPGGHSNAKVLSAAGDCGFKIIGNSVADLHRGDCMNVNRACIRGGGRTQMPLRMASAGPAYWFSKRMKRKVAESTSLLIGIQNYTQISSLIKKAWLRF